MLADAAKIAKISALARKSLFTLKQIGAALVESGICSDNFNGGGCRF
jgi:hypothetical protein